MARALACLIWLAPLAARAEAKAADCSTCHADLLKKKVVHAAAEGGDCSTCHTENEGGGRAGVCKGLPANKGWKLVDEQPKLCGQCHETKAPKVGHGAFTQGRCAGCHDPHSSDEPKLLRASGKALCMRCHDPKGPATSSPAPGGKVSLFSAFKPGGKPVDKAAAPAAAAAPAPAPAKDPNRLPDSKLIDLTKKVQHPPVSDGDCMDCHDAGHGGTREKLLKKPFAQICADCHEAKGPKKFEHAPVKEGECGACHDPHGSDQKGLLRNAPEKLCLDCHDAEALTPKRNKHLPVLEGRCVECHDPHGSDHKAALRADSAELCMKCHDASAKNGKGAPSAGMRIDLKEAGAKVHPALDGGCQTCHTGGHSTDTPRLLEKPTSELCYSCHDRMDQTPFVHGAVKLGDCATCHSPHTSKNDHLLRKAAIKDTCFSCHQDDVTGRAVVHPPVAEGSCDACHEPHGSKYPNNLKEDGKKLCYGCHEEVDKDAKTKHAALERYGCTGCHDPHASGNPQMLAKPVNELCSSCHPQQADGKHVTSFLKQGHKVSGGVDPRHTDREFTCASCHDPHGSPNPRLFYSGADAIGSCDGCHGNISGRHPGAQDISHRKRPKKRQGEAPAAPSTTKSESAAPAAKKS